MSTKLIALIIRKISQVNEIQSLFNRVYSELPCSISHHHAGEEMGGGGMGGGVYLAFQE
jgi:hypothetical protein